LEGTGCPVDDESAPADASTLGTRRAMIFPLQPCTGHFPRQVTRSFGASVLISCPQLGHVPATFTRTHGHPDRQKELSTEHGTA
jgi:hypothetical protein